MLHDPIKDMLPILNFTLTNIHIMLPIQVYYTKINLDEM